MLPSQTFGLLPGRGGGLGLSTLDPWIYLDSLLVGWYGLGFFWVGLVSLGSLLGGSAGVTSFACMVVAWLVAWVGGCSPPPLFLPLIYSHLLVLICLQEPLRWLAKASWGQNPSPPPQKFAQELFTASP